MFCCLLAFYLIEIETEVNHGCGKEWKKRDENMVIMLFITLVNLVRHTNIIQGHIIIVDRTPDGAINLVALLPLSQN